MGGKKMEVLSFRRRMGRTSRRTELLSKKKKTRREKKERKATKLIYHRN